MISPYSSCTTLLSLISTDHPEPPIHSCTVSPKTFQTKEKKMAACYIFIRTPYSAEPKNSHSTRSIFFRENPTEQRDVCGYIYVCVCLWRIAPLNCPAPLEKNLTLPTIMPCKMSYNWRNAAHGCVILQRLPPRSLYNSVIANAH